MRYLNLQRLSVVALSTQPPRRDIRVACGVIVGRCGRARAHSALRRIRRNRKEISVGATGGCLGRGGPSPEMEAARRQEGG